MSLTKPAPTSGEGRLPAEAPAAGGPQPDTVPATAAAALHYVALLQRLPEGTVAEKAANNDTAAFHTPSGRGYQHGVLEVAPTRLTPLFGTAALRGGGQPFRRNPTTEKPALNQLEAFLRSLNGKVDDCVTANDYAVRLYAILDGAYDLTAPMSTEPADTPPIAAVKRKLAALDGEASTVADANAIIRRQRDTITELKQTILTLKAIPMQLGGVRSRVQALRADLQQLRQNVRFQALDSHELVSRFAASYKAMAGVDVLSDKNLVGARSAGDGASGAMSLVKQQQVDREMAHYFASMDPFRDARSTLETALCALSEHVEASLVRSSIVDLGDGDIDWDDESAETARRKKALPSCANLWKSLGIAMTTDLPAPLASIAGYKRPTPELPLVKAAVRACRLVCTAVRLVQALAKIRTQQHEELEATKTRLMLQTVELRDMERKVAQTQPPLRGADGPSTAPRKSIPAIVQRRASNGEVLVGDARKFSEVAIGLDRDPEPKQRKGVFRGAVAKGSPGKKPVRLQPLKSAPLKQAQGESDAGKVSKQAPMSDDAFPGGSDGVISRTQSRLRSASESPMAASLAMSPLAPALDTSQLAGYIETWRRRASQAIEPAALRSACPMRDCGTTTDDIDKVETKRRSLASYTATVACQCDPWQPLIVATAGPGLSVSRSSMSVRQLYESTGDGAVGFAFANSIDSATGGTSALQGHSTGSVLGSAGLSGGTEKTASRPAATVAEANAALKSVLSGAGARPSQSQPSSQSQSQLTPGASPRPEGGAARPHTRASVAAAQARYRSDSYAPAASPRHRRCSADDIMREDMQERFQDPLAEADGPVEGPARAGAASVALTAVSHPGTDRMPTAAGRLPAAGRKAGAVNSIPGPDVRHAGMAAGFGAVATVVPAADRRVLPLEAQALAEAHSPSYTGSMPSQHDAFQGAATDDGAVAPGGSSAAGSSAPVHNQSELQSQREQAATKPPSKIASATMRVGGGAEPQAAVSTSVSPSVGLSEAHPAGPAHAPGETNRATQQTTVDTHGAVAEVEKAPEAPRPVAAKAVAAAIAATHAPEAQIQLALNFLRGRQAPSTVVRTPSPQSESAKTTAARPTEESATRRRATQLDPVGVEQRVEGAQHPARATALDATREMLAFMVPSRDGGKRHPLLGVGSSAARHSPQLLFAPLVPMPSGKGADHLTRIGGAL